ncbi:MAG: hypothetical protein HC892_00180 [Saprospiraceae bacterium]|nr:hypothetical protein [Saprospiraceae bacterium]
MLGIVTRSASTVTVIEYKRPVYSHLRDIFAIIELSVAADEVTMVSDGVVISSAFVIVEYSEAIDTRLSDISAIIEYTSQPQTRLSNICVMIEYMPGSGGEYAGLYGWVV